MIEVRTVTVFGIPLGRWKEVVRSGMKPFYCKPENLVEQEKGNCVGKIVIEVRLTEVGRFLVTELVRFQPGYEDDIDPYILTVVEPSMKTTSPRFGFRTGFWTWMVFRLR